MPTVFRDAGFDIRIYSDDHGPSHVHVIKAGAEVVITLGGPTIRPLVRAIFGMSNTNVRKAFLIVNQQQTFLLREWRRLHG